MKNPALIKEARQFAVKLLWQASENEPQITADLQNIAREIFAEMIGLENKFKSKESLTRKLIDKSYGNIRQMPKKAKIINDALRYTFILPIETYAENLHQTIEELRNFGYRVPEHKVWNAWQTVGSGIDRGYRGVNITVISSQNQKFELQFHTEESFNLKEETHIFYEELRDRNTSSKREIKLIDVLKEAAAHIKRPDGV